MACRSNPSINDLRSEKSPHEIIRRFDHLKRALIDASSIIYSDRAGFLNIVACEIKLFSIKEILAEAGPASDSINPLIHRATSTSNDQKLISFGLECGFPVISDDKKILLAMKRARRPFFNSLMMLNFLLYRRRLNNQQYARHLAALERFARYSDEVWEYGARIKTAILESCKIQVTKELI
jgi:hypothetical protein